MTEPTTDRPTDTIRDAFAAMLALLQMLIARNFSGFYTPAVRLGVEAAEEVDLTHWHPQKAFLALRDLVQRAADEHERIRAAARERLDRVAKARRERKAADLAAGRVTEEDLAEIEARTSGPGPLAEDGALLRRCAAEIRRLTAKLAGIEGVAAQGDGMMLTISEQGAEIDMPPPDPRATLHAGDPESVERCARCDKPAGSTAVRDDVDTLCLACSIDDADSREIDRESGDR